MGRIVGFLADVLALARIMVEARGTWREWTRDRAPAGADGSGDRERPDQPKPPEAGGPGSEVRP